MSTLIIHTSFKSLYKDFLSLKFITLLYLDQYFQYNEFQNFLAFVQIFLEIMSFHNSFVRKLIAKIDPHVWRWKPHIHFNEKLTIFANFNSAHYVALIFSSYEDIDSRANPLQEREDEVILQSTTRDDHILANKV